MRLPASTQTSPSPPSAALPGGLGVKVEHDPGARLLELVRAGSVGEHHDEPMSSGRGIKIESLFIDEGFGALDSNRLAMAVSVLEQLQASGRRVGVISHVDELRERIAVKVEVTPVGGGRSTVQVVTT